MNAFILLVMRVQSVKIQLEAIIVFAKKATLELTSTAQVVLSVISKYCF